MSKLRKEKGLTKIRDVFRYDIPNPNMHLLESCLTGPAKLKYLTF